MTKMRSDPTSPLGPTSTRPKRRSRTASALLALSLTVAICAPAISRADGYDAKKAGNPLKIVYYVVYPIGWTLDVLIFRPAYYIGQCEPFHTIFGTDRHPEEIDSGAEAP